MYISFYTIIILYNSTTTKNKIVTGPTAAVLPRYGLNRKGASKSQGRKAQQSPTVKRQFGGKSPER